jgi:sugar/nucleoside kinase (ribokinase family)
VTDLSSSTAARRPHIVTIGDVMLDVIVSPSEELHLDDDVNAAIVLGPGGQAANVARWAVELGADATVIGPRGDSVAAQFVAERLASSGVSFVGVGEGRVGTVVSIIDANTRTMASDAGHQGWVGAVGSDLLPDEATALFVSGYPLLRAFGDPTPFLAVCAVARERGVRVSVDLASNDMIDSYGPASFAATVAELRPDVVFANAAEWLSVGRHWTQPATVVVKDGARDVAVIHPDGARSLHHVDFTRPVDPTGAGDALAAGYLVDGVELGIRAAARCVARRGAQPD